MSARAGAGPADPGLQPERTWLAWNRTGSALLVTGVLGLRWAESLGAWLTLTAVLGAIAASALGATRRRRATRLANTPLSRLGAPSPAAVAALAAMVFLFGALAALVVALG
ncbi:DUF202 domain-containing protein [Microbacterium sp. JZ31]|uniref:DUF202 domain-containing protein n=1 Tax=Microbacterium sp. JZ31 TaxID=1906274 RepID=UPI001932CA54|nr:DUF202 domain-containing protein [Microbacterium sp. JZ31]